MKSKRIAVLILSAGTLACTTVKEEVKQQVVEKPLVNQNTTREVFASSVKAFDEGNLDVAKEGFARVAARVPGNVTVQYNLGVISERQGRLVDAAKYYEAAHKLDVKHKPTLLNLGRVYRQQDRFEDAIGLYEQALKDPANEYDVELNNNLTVSYRLAKKYDLAEATARKVLSRTKDNADAYKNLSLIYFDQGNYRLAEFISANARKLDEKDPGVYNNLGLIQLKLEDRRAALVQFQKAVSLNKDFAPSLFNIGAMALAYRDYDGAEKVLSRATELDPSSYEGLLAYAWALDGQKGRDKKKAVKAGEVFEKVLAIKSGQSDAVCGAGWAYAEDKSGWDKALGFLQQCRDIAGIAQPEQQRVDSRIKSIQNMQKAGAEAAARAEEEAKKAEEEKKRKAAAGSGGPSILDKAAEDAAKSDPGTGEAPAPAPEGAAPEATPEPKS